jgi:mannuronan 5-epimerase
MSSHAHAAAGSIKLCPALSDPELYKDKENEDFSRMVAGKDGWLFRSRFDLKFRFRLTERTLDSFQRLAEAFRRNGSELVVVMMPTRGLVHYEELLPPQSEEFDVKAAKKNYLQMLSELRSTGLAVADMSNVDEINNYFLKRDNHWTTTGAEFTAQKVSEVIKALPAYNSLKKTSFKTNPLPGESKEATHRYAEFVNKICGTDIPREMHDVIYQTENIDAGGAEESLFGDKTAEISLLGTSNSTSPEPSYANFEGFLKEYLEADIFNEAVSGGSLQGSISNYLLSGRYSEHKPKIVIWEMSAHYGFNQQAFLREIVPAVYGECNSENLIAETTQSLNGTDNILFKNLSNKNISSDRYYLSLKLSDKKHRTAKIRFTHADGRYETVKLERSARSFPENNGAYFVELSDVMTAPLDKVELNLKQSGGQAEVKLCKVPEPTSTLQKYTQNKPQNQNMANTSNRLKKPGYVKNWAEKFSWLSNYNVSSYKNITAKKQLLRLPDLKIYNAKAVIDKMPLLANGEIKVESMEGAPPLRKFAFDKRLVEFQNIQKSIDPKAVHIYSGSYDISSLQKELKDANVLIEKEDRYILRRPVAIYPGASLIIKDLKKPLQLSQESGAFIASAGNLFVINSTIQGWNEAENEPAKLKSDMQSFRPFITTWDGSETYLVDSKLEHLGYALSKSYGITFSTNDVVQEEFEEEYGDLQPPTGWAINNVFNDIYFGFYSYEAKNVVLLNNLYKDNIIYGIDPHDRSEGLIIAYNNVTGSKKKHGIIISRDVKDSFIVYNKVKNNNGSGIMLDRNSTNNVIAYNDVQFNNDGITLYESPDNFLYENKIENNKGSGVRIRNSWNIEVEGGNVNLNGGYAFEIYEDTLENTNRDFDLDPVLSRSSAVFRHVRLESNQGILKTNSFESIRFEWVNLENNLNSKMPFAGDISSKSATLEKYAKEEAQIFEIKSDS